MSKLAIPVVLLIVSYAIFFGYVAATYSELPAKVASHFDLYGHANGWMSRETCVAFMVGIVVIVPVIVIASMGGAGRIPVSFINLPHRDYWLAPERRQAALAILLRYSLLLASITVLLMTGLHWLVVQANLHGGTQLNLVDLWSLLGGFLVVTVVWTVLLLRHFSKIK
jgi:hypothetical protein